MSELMSMLARLPEQLSVLFTDPSSNLQAAYALYAFLGLAVLIVVVVAMIALTGMSDDDEQPAAQAPASDDIQPAPARTPRSRAVIIATTVLVVALIWGVAGNSTSSREACEGCHAKSPHATQAKGGRDPHGTTACVSCHEPGGDVGRYVLGVPARAVHIVGNLAEVPVPSYGRISSAACSSCHGEAIASTTVDGERGLRMSHREPLAASATCTDCHRLNEGVVVARDMGMGTCIRCHDSKSAPAACATCHEEGASSAARARRVSPSVRVTDVKCGGCHDEKVECDSCHGSRMPHSAAFKVTAHARAAAVDFWYNGGQGCSRCHTAERRPCTRCHSDLLGRGHSIQHATTHQLAVSSSCDSCHLAKAASRSRDFCRDVCHSPEAIAESPR